MSMENEEKAQFTPEECEKIEKELKKIYGEVGYLGSIQKDIFCSVYSMFSPVLSYNKISLQQLPTTENFKKVKNLGPVFYTIKQVREAANKKSIYYDGEIKNVFKELFNFFGEDGKKELAEIFKNEDSRQNVIEIIKELIDNVDQEKKISSFNITYSFVYVCKCLCGDSVEKKAEIFKNEDSRKNVFKIIKELVDNVDPEKDIDLLDINNSFVEVANLFEGNKADKIEQILEILEKDLIGNVTKEIGQRKNLFYVTESFKKVIEYYAKEEKKEIKNILNNDKEMNNVSGFLKIKLLGFTDLKEAYEEFLKEKMDIEKKNKSSISEKDNEEENKKKEDDIYDNLSWASNDIKKDKRQRNKKQYYKDFINKYGRAPGNGRNKFTRWRGIQKEYYTVTENKINFEKAENSKEQEKKISKKISK